MEIVSLSGLPTGSILWQQRPGMWVLTVVCKATFALQPGELPLAPEQEPLNTADRPWSDDVRSLYAATDLVPKKPLVDVLLVGQAYAAGDVPVRSLVARLRVGDVDKSVEIFCDRTRQPDGTVHEGPPFARMPLLYERAAGGAGTANPAGMSLQDRDGYGNAALPNLLRLGTAVTSSDDVLDPVGFGPLDPTWPGRTGQLGRHAGTWSLEQLNRRPLPEDIDPAYFNAAPPDQRVPALREDAHLHLDNLHPEHPRFTTSLPGLRPQAFFERRGVPQEIALRCDTLWIDTARLVCTLTWRGHVMLERALEDGRIYLATAKAGQKLTWADVRPAAARSSVAEEESTFVGEVKPAEGADGEAPSPVMPLPFAPVVPGLPTAASVPASAPTPAPAPSPGAAGGAPQRRKSPQTMGLPVFTPTAGSAPSWIEQSAPRAEARRALEATAPPAPSRVTSVTPPVAPLPVAPPPLAPPAVVAPPLAPPAVVPPPLAPPSLAQPSAPAVDSPWASSGASRPSVAPPPPVVPASISSFDSRAGGVLAASNAAKDAWTTPAPVVTPAAAPLVIEPAARAAARAEPPEPIQLLWYDPASLPRMRRVPRWQRVLREISDKPVDGELDDPALAADPMEQEDRREVFELLTVGPATDGAGLQEVMASAIREDGKFLPQLALLAGDLQLPFDELETLKATTTTVAPLVGQDEALKAIVEIAKDFLRTPGLLASAATADGLTNRIKEAFNAGRRVVPAGYLEQQVERVLLEKRAYSRREVLGARHLRGLLHLPGASAPVPAYMVEALAVKLPMFTRFKVRVVASVDASVDQYETSQAALKVLAIARMLPAPKPKERS